MISATKPLLDPTRAVTTSVAMAIAVTSLIAQVGRSGFGNLGSGTALNLDPLVDMRGKGAMGAKRRHCKNDN